MLALVLYPIICAAMLIEAATAFGNNAFQLQMASTAQYIGASTDDVIVVAHVLKKIVILATGLALLRNSSLFRFFSWYSNAFRICLRSISLSEDRSRPSAHGKSKT